MPTLFTDPRSGGIKKSSGVNVLPIVQETWAEVRDDSNSDVDWLIAGYHGNSKTDITVLTKGHGGLTSCANVLPSATPVFGGVRLSRGRFVTFFYADEGTSVMKKGRASMHKNGVLNVLEGSDCEIEIWPGLTEDDVGKSRQASSVNSGIAETNTNTNTNTNLKSFDKDNIEKPEETAITADQSHAWDAFPSTKNEDIMNGSTMKSKSMECTTSAASKKPKSEKRTEEFSHIDRKMKALDINALDDGSQQNNPTTHNNATKTDMKIHTKPSSFKNQNINSSLPSSSSDQAIEHGNNPTSNHNHNHNHNHNQSSNNAPPDTNDEEKEVKIAQRYVPYSELKSISDVSELPEGVDALNREASLSDEEFHDVFGMNKESFYKLPSWKRVKHKKDKLLF